MLAMPLEENNIVIRPIGGLVIMMIGTITVALDILTAPTIKSEESASDTTCPNAQQNIMIVSTPTDSQVARHARNKEIGVQDKRFEVSG